MGEPKPPMARSTYHLIQALLYFLIELVFIAMACGVRAWRWSDILMALAVIGAALATWKSCKHGMAFVIHQYCEDTREQS